MKKQRPPRFATLAIVLTILFVSTLSSRAIDLDGDGMSDVWQRAHNIATGDTTSDIDGDGQSNAKEAEAGTDPRDPNDYFRTFDFTVSPYLDEVSLSWRSVEYRYYEIQQSTDLVSWNYASYGYGEFDQTTTTTTFYPYPSGQAKMFFRVRGYPDYDYDYDGDGLLSWEERLLGTDPYDYDGDTDNDGMPDGFEFIYQFDPLSVVDAQQDADGDLLANAWEARLGLNPRLTTPMATASPMPMRIGTSMASQTSPNCKPTAPTPPSPTPIWMVCSMAGRLPTGSIPWLTIRQTVIRPTIPEPIQMATH